MYTSDEDVRKDLGLFIREFNRREWSVRIGKTHSSFEDYVKRGYRHREEYGTGFVIDERPVPYFHPNRSFHDEIIWLNNNLYYNKEVSFENRLLNSAIVKFYGPSRTLDIITGYANLPYLTRTETPYIDFGRFRYSSDTYSGDLLRNIELAFAHKQQIWGTTELRTSLQIACRNHVRANPSHIDYFGLEYNGRTIVDRKDIENIDTRKMRPSDMISWISSLGIDMVEFYSSKPTMEQSFEFLTRYRGIGNYYGYHFSSNLARMPGIGSAELIDKEYGESFRELQRHDRKLSHGSLDENADYVMAGPGAMATLKRLYPNESINTKNSMRMIIDIRDRQEEFFGITDEESKRHLSEATELGRFTTFGIEIGLCQYNVFTRLKNDDNMARNRANAPISKEVGSTTTNSLESFFT